MQWGDEGKGKIVDVLGETCQVVARFQGGANAGHTVKFNHQQYILHLLPSGILRPHIQCIIGNGVVIDPISLLEEIETIEACGIEVISRLFISENAHLILPYHKMIDQAVEEAKAGSKIGTTGRGIGPAYSDKTNRTGIRVGDLIHAKDWKLLIRERVAEKNEILEKFYYQHPLDPDVIIDQLVVFLNKVGDCIADTTALLHRAIHSGQKVLLEGAQGTLLDIDFGTYPYVTSSNTTVGGVCTGLGLGPKQIHQITGILKAYTTRVGNGPFPTELDNALGEHIRQHGGEFGATTGRPRRCGWFDAAIARFSVMVNDIDSIALTKMDVLDTLDEIKICTGYTYHGETLPVFPTNCHILEHIEPQYITMKGWKTNIASITRYQDLPGEAQAYVEKIEELVGAPIQIVSVGPGRDQSITRCGNS